MKLCQNCIHYNGNMQSCMHDSAISSIDLVDGRISRYSAGTNRKAGRLKSWLGHYCGKHARFFKDKALDEE